MNTRINLLPPPLEPDICEAPAAEPEIPLPSEPGEVSGNRFADEQIRRLVRQLFIPGWPRPARHVVFSAVDTDSYMADICVDIGRCLAAQVTGSVCVVEANLDDPQLEEVFASKHRDSVHAEGEGRVVRSLCQHIGGRLWLASRAVLLGEDSKCFSAAGLERRLVELHLEFDYTVLHGPSAGSVSEILLLGRLSDGVVMVLEAQRTRRAAAQKAKDLLQSANVRLLGSVLSERKFPIPASVYRRL